MKMDKFTIEIDTDLADKIVVRELIDTWQMFKKDLGAKNNIFAWDDPKQDDVEIQKHIDALELLLKWYATSEQLKALGLDPE